MALHEVVLITGANTGLGFQIARALYDSNTAYNIVLGGRSVEKVQTAVKSLMDEYPSSRSKAFSIQVDIEQDESIHKAFDEVKSQHGRVDVLINNAGAQYDQQLASGHMTMRQMWNASWNVNTVGTQVMTHTFVPLLLQSSNPRLLFITSGTSTLAGTDNMALAVNRYPPKGWPKTGGPSFDLPAYRSSKTGMNMMMREWYRMLKEDGVKVWCISPGQLATGLGGNPENNRKIGGGDPAVAGKFVQSVVEGARDSDVGQVVLRDRIQAW